MEPWYDSIIKVAKTYFKIQGLKFTVSGTENVPATGGFVLAPNHTGYLDFLHSALPVIDAGRKVRFMAKKETFDNKFSGPLMRGCKHIPVDRVDGAESYRLAVAALRAGEVVGVYPEATISRSFEIKKFKSGAARMAIEAGVPIVPVIVWGSQRVATKGHPKRFGRVNVPITVKVGKPIVPSATVEETNAQLHKIMEDMLAEVQAGYEHEPGAYWVPAKLGGSAPTLEEATKLDDADVEARKKARAEREANQS